MSIRHRALLAILVLLTAGTHANACLWLHGTTIEGHYKRVEGFDPAKILKERIKDHPANEKGFFKTFHYQPDDPVARKNDEAVQVLLKGNPAKAVTMLEKIEAEHPGQYYTAANLGTALELAGDDVAALKWIKEGIRRNPKSHMHTEWLHARILETKINLKDDPAWMKTHTITGADFEQIKSPGYSLDTLQRPVTAEDIRESLHSQIEVRMLFVKPKDVIVAQLLKELALVEAKIGFLQQAVAYTELGELYGLDASALASERAAWKETIRKTPPVLESELQRRRLITRVLLGGGAVLLLVILTKVWQKRKRRVTAQI
jgi:hypothetical protein